MIDKELNIKLIEINNDFDKQDVPMNKRVMMAISKLNGDKDGMIVPSYGKNTDQNILGGVVEFYNKLINGKK